MCTRALVRSSLAAAVLIVVAAVALADVTIDMVLVGDEGNAPDTRYNGISVGSVGTRYEIGKYEISAGQYAAFLNAVAKTDTYALYNPNMGNLSVQGCNIQRTGSSGDYIYAVAVDWADRPVNYVSFWDAARFANWLNNGQPIGLQDARTTEDGAYALNGYTGQDSGTITRKNGALFWLPSEDEWYKAAYYKGGGTNAGYWDYATQSNTSPSNILTDPDPGNNGNLFGPPGITGYAIGSPYYRTPVGAYGNSKSAYDTYDQSGNVYEWNDTLVGQTARGLRGGCYYQYTYYAAASWWSRSQGPSTEWRNYGFRVATVPEATTLGLLAVGGLGLLFYAWRRRKQRA